ncbi:GTPase-associated protein 1-related protein [Dactylosporangium sp. NPDC049742]|uniref:GTPase-associated protein 1-related protein n=1 Tax=Dactylosporangium sp. NPDC049742 TaxID=3154737 RepID=UPI003447D8DC
MDDETRRERSAATFRGGTRAVRTVLLYEPAGRDEPGAGDPPQPSFRHVAAGGSFATTLRRHLDDAGQVSHGIVTDDPADYGTLRPAQLFGAPLWSPPPASAPPLAPAPPVASGSPVAAAPPVGSVPPAAGAPDSPMSPPPGPRIPGGALAGGGPATTLTPALVRERVVAQPGGAAMLLALVSALDRAGEPDAPVVVLVGAEVTRIVEWIVAGTLLLPPARALALGFEVKAGDPATAGVPVVGVDPATAAGLTGRGYAVFDLAAGAFPATTPTAHALRWVGGFLQDDPRAVVEALDLAAASGLEPDAAAALGLAAVLRREPALAHAPAVAGWLRDGPQALRRAYTGGITDMFTSSVTAWPRPVLEALDDAAADGLLPGRAAAVRLALLRGETDAAALRAEVATRVPPALPAGEWTAADNTTARRLVLAALNAGPAPLGSEALLRVAGRFGIDVQPSDLADRGRDLVEFWAGHPRAGFDPGLWPCGDRLTAALVDELTRRVKAVPVRRHDIAAGWWRWLLPRIATLEPPLAEAVLAGAVSDGGADGAGRAVLVEHHLTAASHDPDRFLSTAAALWSLADPSVDELRLLKRLAPAGVVLPAKTLEGLIGRLVGDAPLAHEDVDVAHRLVDAGLVPRHRRLFQLLADDRALRAVVRRLTTAPAGPAGRPLGDGPVVALLHELEELPARLVALHAPGVAAALARSAPPRELLAVLRRHPGVVEHYVTLLSDLLRKPGDERHAVIAYHLMHNNDSRGLRPVLTAPVLRWATRASSRQLRRVGELIAGFGPAWSASWAAYLEHVRSQRRICRLIHPFGNH